MAGKVKAKRLQKKVHNLASVTAPAHTQAVKKDQGVVKVIDYGANNMLPSDILRTFLASPTARRCIRKIKRFIQADGFSNRAAAMHIVNQDKQRADDILPPIAYDLATLEGFALKVKYKGSMEVGEVYHVPFHTIRKLEDGRFLVNPTLGSKNYKKDQDEILEPFDNSAETVLQVIALAKANEKELGAKAQPGQILYVYEGNSAQPHYPEPDAWAAKEDIESDPEIQRADYNAIRKRVKPNIGVYIPGDIDELTKNEDGRTEYDEIEEMVQDLTDPEGEGDPILFYGETKDDIPQLIEMPGMKAQLPMDQKSDTIRRRICMAFGLHPTLIGMSTTGQLGNTQELQNIIQLTQQEVLDKQGLIHRVFDRLWPQFDWTLTSLNILKTLPDQIWQTFDENERRNYLGLAEVEQNADLDKFNRLPDLLKQKILDDMTPEQRLELAGLKEKEQPTTAQAKKTNGADERKLHPVRAFFKKHNPF